MAGDLKLAYAQFEELDTFARFGSRLDDDTRKSIEHGRHIRACLMQTELAPVAVPAQIAVLIALAAGLFDVIPLVQMKNAQQVVHHAATEFSSEIIARFTSADKLSDEDRELIIGVTKKALTPFQSSARP